MLLTEDQREWLDAVLHWGGEITTFMLKEDYLKGDRDWKEVQFELYKKDPFKEGNQW